MILLTFPIQVHLIWTWTYLNQYITALWIWMAIDAMIMLDKLHMCHELDTTSLDSRSVRTPVRQEQHLTADAGFVKTNLQQHNGGDGLTKADS